MMESTTAQDGATPRGSDGVHDETIAKLDRMAGQIADFFKAYPEAEAVPAIADHINQFWTSRMRADFLAAHRARPEGLTPLLGKVLPLIRPPRSG